MHIIYLKSVTASYSQLMHYCTALQTRSGAEQVKVLLFMLQSQYLTSRMTRYLKEFPIRTCLQVQALVSKATVDAGAAASWLLYQKGSSLTNEISESQTSLK